MSDIRVFLAGEGRNELGSRSGELQYQSDDEPGCIATMLRKVRSAGWVVGGARQWNSTKRYVAMPRTSTARGLAKRRFEREDSRIVLVVVNDAIDAGCSVAAFLRDVDNDTNREDAIKLGIDSATEIFGESVRVVGAAVVPTLEGWLLAALGDSGTEQLSRVRAERNLKDRGIDAKSTSAYVAIFEKTDIGRLPRDATRMRAWFTRAAEALAG